MSTCFKVLAAIDQTAVSKKIIQHTAKLAQNLRNPCEVTFIYIVALNPPSFIPGLNALDRAFNTEIESDSKKFEEQLASDIKDIVKDKIEYEFNSVEAEGDPGFILVEHIKKYYSDIDLLIMGTKNETLLSRIALGSTSNYCVNHLNCPITLIKPN